MSFDAIFKEWLLLSLSANYNYFLPYYVHLITFKNFNVQSKLFFSRLLDLTPIACLLYLKLFKIRSLVNISKVQYPHQLSSALPLKIAYNTLPQ